MIEAETCSIASESVESPITKPTSPTFIPR